jgi:hypothetical protein
MAETKIFTMRMDAGLLGRIDQVGERYYRSVSRKGPAPKLSRAETIRWLLTLGLEEVERRGAARGRGGAR